MPSLLTEDALTTSTAKISCTTSCTTRSLFALALHALNLCVFLVVVVALLLLSPAAVVILLPVACMAASVCLLCATTARLLAPSVAPGRRAPENRGGVRERKKQDCVEVDRAEAPAGGFSDGGGASSAEEEHGEQEQGRSSFSFSPFDEELSDSWGDDEQQGRFFFVDTSSYCRTVSII